MALPEKRWIQRFDNYLSVLQHLESFVAIRETRPLSVAEEFATIKAFELAFECAWNVLKDYLEGKGNTADIHGSRDAVRNAFRMGIIDNGEIWFDMIKSRNNTAHVYDEETAQEVSFVVSNEYMDEFRKFKSKFEKYKQEQE
jgi:nucleotidyltransferase substrate binding protein (TIGR01987 family)